MRLWQFESSGQTLNCSLVAFGQTNTVGIWQPDVSSFRMVKSRLVPKRSGFRMEFKNRQKNFWLLKGIWKPNENIRFSNTQKSGFWLFPVFKWLAFRSPLYVCSCTWPKKISSSLKSRVVNPIKQKMNQVSRFSSIVMLSVLLDWPFNLRTNFFWSFVHLLVLTGISVNAAAFVGENNFNSVQLLFLWKLVQ